MDTTRGGTSRLLNICITAGCGVESKISKTSKHKNISRLEPLYSSFTEDNGYATIDTKNDDTDNNEGNDGTDGNGNESKDINNNRRNNSRNVQTNEVTIPEQQEHQREIEKEAHWSSVGKYSSERACIANGAL